jgi:serine/threonine protein kinase
MDMTVPHPGPALAEPDPFGFPGAVVAGRYRLTHPLGTGGMGLVWAAEEEGRPVALKEFHDLPGRPALHQACAEAAATRRVAHPGVVAVHDVLVVAGVPWLVMERVVGQSLAAMVAHGGRLALPAVVGLGERLLDVLGAVHRSGLVHLDVTPGNVLLGVSGRVVLGDFGLAAETGRPAEDLVRGTPPYMAPEVLCGEAPDHRADLFALGATLWLAAEGRRPFEGSSPAELAGAVLDGQPRRAEHSGALAPVLHGLLEKDPARRPTAAAAAHHIRALRAGEPAAPAA